MEDLLIYQAKVAAGIAAFWLAYIILFRRQKQFRFNRLYLCGSLILSFAIPLITFTIRREIDLSQFLALESLAGIDAEFLAVTETVAAPPKTDWRQMAVWLLAGGTLICLLRLLAGHIKVLRLLRKCRKTEINGVAVYVGSPDVRPFAFFNKIVLPENILDNPILPLILKHERTHVQKQHWLDNLFAELACGAQWVNPFAWLMRKDLKNNLEFEADNDIIREADARDYQLALLQLAGGRGFASPFLTALNSSGLKTRIKMMKMKSNPKNLLLRKLTIVPLTIALIIGLSNKEFKAAINYENLSALVGEETAPQETNKSMTAQELMVEEGKSIIDELVIVEDKPKTVFERLSSGFDGNNDPLVLLDGKEIGKEELAKLTDNIANVTILKDANTTERYGEKGKNGVILITSKKAEDSLSAKQNTESRKSIIDEIVIVDDKPKSMPDFFIRGLDINDSPLIFLDGKEIDKEELAKLSLDNIKSFSVLKDASATTVYGEKGKNGALIITTKNADDDNEFAIKAEGGIRIYDARIKKPDTLSGQSKLAIIEEDKSTTFLHLLIRYLGGNNPPLIILDGKEISKEELTKLAPENIEHYYVYKDAMATERFGEKGKNGVIVVISKKAGDSLSAKQNKENRIWSEGIVIADDKPKTSSELLIRGLDGNSSPLILIDGKKSDNDELAKLQPDNIASFSVLKDSTATILYGEKGKNGVIQITLKKADDLAAKDKENRIWSKDDVIAIEDLAQKKSANDEFFRVYSPVIKPKTSSELLIRGLDGNNSPLILIDGKESDSGELAKLQPDDIKSFSVLKDSTATIIYGERGKNGVISVALWQKQKISTTDELRRYFADNLKYPVKAIETGKQGSVDIYLKVDNNGNITDRIFEAPESQTIDLDAFTVSAFKTGGTVTQGEGKESNDNSNPLLRIEVENAVKGISAIDINDYKGKWLKVNVNFKLQ